VPPRSLNLLTFNIQAGTSTDRYHRYVTDSWRQVLPNTQRVQNLDAISSLLREYDVVALQEVDAGSLRSGFINQTRYLASHSGIPFWCHQTNRRVGRFAYAGNGFLARFEPDVVEERRLPGAIPGRGALLVRYGEGASSLTFAAVHLALGRRARQQQLRFLTEELADSAHLIVMGDLNTATDSPELTEFLENLELDAPTAGLASYPSWQPQRAIDHVLVSRSLPVGRARTLPLAHSDHCPVAVEIHLPDSVDLQPAGHVTRGVDFTPTSG